MSTAQSSRRIQSLSPLLIDCIAAGEVIEGPSSVIKELAENSLDADASSIRIATEAAGTENITVEDNGKGIHFDDLGASLRRYATSKIHSLEDLEKLRSFGFRGEALAAIAAVSYLQLKSRFYESELAGQVTARGGEILRTERLHHKEGTSLSVSNLFYSTPARRKYLKAPRAENAKNHKEILRLALSAPQAHLRYYRDGKEFAFYPARESILERILDVQGRQIEKQLIEIQAEHEGTKLWGYIAAPEYTRLNREGQYSFVNGRPVEMKNFSFFVRRAYDELLPANMYPCYFLFLEIDPVRIDVNVHPQKRELRLLDQSLLQSLVFDAVSRALRPHAPLQFEQLKYKKQIPEPKRKAPAKAGSYEKLFSGELYFTPSHIFDSNKGLEKPKEGNSMMPLPNFDSNKGLEKTKAYKPLFNSGAASAQKQRQPADLGDLGLAPVSRPKQEASFCLERHFGTVFGTYILAQGPESLYIIDQHTAHERINYEKNLARMEESLGERQALLEPILIQDVLPDELEEIVEKQDQLLEHGFLIEVSGPQAYVLREAPPYLEAGEEREVLLGLIQRVMGSPQSKQIHLYRDYAAMRSCKASIKKNDAISPELLADILKELPLCKEPARCPHGRPTMIELSHKALDRLFQR